MTRARHTRPQRLRVFLAGEGNSEQSYGTFLHRLVEHNHKLHIDPVPLGGGDPLAIAERAFKICRFKERDYGQKYFARAVLLDADKLGENVARDRQIHGVLYAGAIMPIWQTPTHEALLLRHIQGCEALRPPTAVLAMHRLKQEWPDYQKGGAAAYLQERISLEGVQLACSVEPDLRAFLEKIRFFG